MRTDTVTAYVVPKKVEVLIAAHTCSLGANGASIRIAIEERKRMLSRGLCGRSGLSCWRECRYLCRTWGGDAALVLLVVLINDEALQALAEA